MKSLSIPQLTKPSDNMECRQMMNTLDRLQKERLDVISRKSQIETVLSQPREITDRNADAWHVALAGGGDGLSTDKRRELAEEFQWLTDRESFLDSALADGRQALDAVVGRLSLEPCSQIRPAFVTQIKRILFAFKEIDDAMTILEDLREGLENDGVRTGSIPSAVPPNIGSIASSYRSWIKTNFPEAKSD